MKTRQLTATEAAEALALKPQTLRIWRLKGIGPRYVRYGGPRGRVTYRESDIEAWIAERVHESTSEESAKASE